MSNNGYASQNAYLSYFGRVNYDSEPEIPA